MDVGEIAGKKYMVLKAMIVQRIGKGDSDHQRLSTTQLSDEKNRGRKTRRLRAGRVAGLWEGLLNRRR